MPGIADGLTSVLAGLTSHSSFLSNWAWLIGIEPNTGFIKYNSVCGYVVNAGNRVFCKILGVLSYWPTRKKAVVSGGMRWFVWGVLQKDLLRRHDYCFLCLSP